HPSRVLTLVYQPFALGTLAILTYKEAKINTRRRNLFGYIIFSTSALDVLVLHLENEELGLILEYVSLAVLLELQMLMFRVEWLEIYHSCYPSSCKLYLWLAYYLI
ncbi:hypothetical protein HYC85_000772, partial [Camellia sinensis]